MKKYLKKSLSTFLALLMVFTSLVFVVPEVAPEAGAAYDMPAAKAPDTYIKMAKSGYTSEYFAIYYPSAIYLDVTETLQGAGYYINFADWEYLNGNVEDNARRMIILPSLWGGTGADSDVLHTQAFSNYGISFVGQNSGTWGTDSYDGGTAYIQWIAKNEGNKNYTENIKGYLQGTPKAEQAGKVLTYSLSGNAKLWESSNRAYNSKGNMKDSWSKNYTITQGGDVVTNSAGQTGANISISIHIYDKKELSTLIETASGYTTDANASKYTPESVNALKAAITSAQTVRKTREVTQGDIDQAVTALQTAIDNLAMASIDANFENLFSFADWCASANTFAGEVTKDVFNGKLTLKNTATTGEQTLQSSYKVPVQAGKTYTIEYVRGEELTTDVYFFFNGAQPPSSLFNETLNKLQTNKKGEVQKKEFTVPSGVTYLIIRFDANEPGKTYTFYGLKIYESAHRADVTLDNDRIVVSPDKDTGKGALGELPTATKPGYIFGGWFTGENGTGTQITAETEIGASATYHAKWTPVKNKAEFYTYDGQLHASVQGDYMTKVSAAAPTAPASYTNAAGTFVFYRWVNMETGAVLGNELFDSINEGDLVAKYKAEYKRSGDLTNYTATFKNPADASYNQTVTGKFNESKGSPTTYPAKAAEKINGVDAYAYEFIGWALEDGGDIVIEPGDAFRILENVTYYAQFKQVLAQHTVNTVFGTNDGGANAGHDSKTADYGEWIEIPNAAEWRDQTSSYIFSHWVDSKGNTYEPSGNKVSVQVLGPETYTAVYDAVPVRYHAYFNNGTELYFDQELSFGDYVTIPEGTPVKDRVGNTTYEFDGWYLYNEETKVWGEKLEDNKFAITGDDYTFHAKYNEIKWVNVSFLKDAASGFEPVGDAKEYKWGDAIVVPEGPKKSSTAQYDYTFTGWTEFYDGQEGAFYPAGSEITAPARDAATLYIATYEETVRQYTVTFYGEDGETVIGEAQTVDYGTRPVAPADPTKESTERYNYVFDGWYDGSRIYEGTEIPAVTGDVKYTAVFTGQDIYYPVTWLTPAMEDGNKVIKPFTTVNYTYNRVISMPASAPVFENSETRPGMTWGFAGWYLADAAGNLLDAEGNIINAEDYKDNGVLFAKGTHITSALYYIAVFDFIPNPYRVDVYDENGNLLKAYNGSYGTIVNITNFEKASDADKHYTLLGFATTEGGNVVINAGTITEDGVTVLDTVTAVTVNGNLKLYVVYEEEAHIWGDWATDEEPTYKDKGSKHRDCTECSYKQTAEIPVLIDTFNPVGQIAIGGNRWTNEYELTADDEPVWNSESNAYVRADSIISVLTTDVGNGIKSIKYTWSDGATHTYEVEEEFDTAVNYNFLMPENFQGKYLDVVITDYAGKTHKIQSATLQLDEAAPMIQTHVDCLWFGFIATDSHEIDTIVVTDADGKEVAYSSVQIEDENGETIDALIVGDMEENSALAAGEYTITVTDKAGNATAETVYVAGEHIASDWIIDTDAACLTEGTKHKECTVCGKTLETGKIEALTHDMNDEEWVAANTEWKVTKDPACEQAGEQTLYCKLCKDALMTAPVDALIHNYEEAVTAPTCEDAGYTTYTCSLCGDAYVGNYVDALGHDMQIAEEVEATCEKAGYTVYRCANGCGEEETVTGAPALNHPEDQRETITIESECTESTLTKVVCKLCGEVLSQEGNLDGHEWTEEDFAATCTKDAYTVKTCSKCDAEITIVHRLTKLGHAWDADYTVDKAADCTTAGEKSIHCSACDEVKDKQVIPALGHELVLNEESAVAPTCNTDGYELWECSRCDYEEEKTIKATGEHVFATLDEDASYDATCTTDGLEVYKCGGTGCTATKEVVIKALGHVKGDKIAETAGNCQTRATATYECRNCDDTITEEGNFGAHTASDVLVKTIKAATCTAVGDGVFKCKDCDATVIVTGGIAALGHDYKETVTDATCVEDGVITKTCSRCGDTIVSAGDEATGEHTWNTEYTVITEATCTTNGSKAIYCSICGEPKPESTVIIPSTGHTESDWIIDSKATCTENGSKHTECTVCGTTNKTETIQSKGGHVQGALVKTNTPATCSKTGEGVYKCTTCGETYISTIAIDANNHSYSEWRKVDATCTGEGYQIKTCTNKDANGKVCGAEVKKTVPALGHNYKLVKEEIVEQGGNFVTKLTYKCSRCNGTYTDTVATTAYVVTIVDIFNDETSTVILKDGAQLRKSDLPAVAIPDDVEQTTYVLTWTDAAGKELRFPMDITANTTIYAKITAITKTYTIEFVNNSGKIISSKEYTYGATVEAPEDQMLLNSTFLGWSDGINTYAGDAIPAVTGNATYSAKFQANPGIKTYYVTFKNETGSKTMFTQTITAGGNATAPEAIPEKALNSVYHYVFAGWYTATEGGSAYDFGSAVDANITVYARFTAVKHSANASHVSTNATCSDPASKAYTCNVCGYEWVTYTDPATGHSYKETGRTTSADGKVHVTYVCSVCGDTWTKTVTQGMADSNAIIVTVTDTNGNPVEGASVSIYIGNLQVTVAVTNSKGKAYFAKDVVADGSYRVNVTKNGYDDLSGTLVVKDGKGTVKLSSFSMKVCRCVCHANSFFGNIRRWFTNLLRSIFKNYTCCDCGNCGHIY